jgi:NAD(P) transhydrogenase subunit alpha
MQVGVPKEILAGERRVSATPATVKRIMKLGFSVLVESGAGDGASYPDSAYEEAGASIAPDAKSVWASADVITKVGIPTLDEAKLLEEGKTLISVIRPAEHPKLLDTLAGRKANVVAMDCVPRISRAQKMDILSSMANIAGYRAVVEASNLYGGFFAGQITAAGKTRPATVLVIGAGVAGLAAIAAARSMGAIVKAFDTREAVKEQVESLGAEFLELKFEESGEGTGGYAKLMSKEFIEAEMALFRKQALTTDIIITTALIPGRPAPLLVPEDVVANLKPGSVIIDMAAETGGNCALTKADEVVTYNGVKIVGYTDLTSRLACHASQFYGTNIYHMLDEMGGVENWSVDLDNDAVRGAVVFREGELMWPPPKLEPSPQPKVENKPAPVAPPVKKKKSRSKGHAHADPDPASGTTVLVTMVVAASLLIGLAVAADSDFLQRITVFVLACFIGYQVVWNVTPALHTPLMSVTNAISGIIIVGGLLQVSQGELNLATYLGVAAILVASINVFGGFIVTQRMLKMFRK